MACKFPYRCRHLKKGVRLIRAENKITQLCLQIELAEEKSPSLYPWWAQQMYITKENFLRRPETFWQI